tara:strand:+ start:210 stop:710 length:501 start_codon:yes stop_codon:yes gene_type:complete
MNLLKSLLFFVGLLILSRLIPHPPNFTPLLAGAVFLPFLLKDKTLIVALPLVCLFISDLIIGFHNVMLWTYGAFFIIGITVINFSKLNLKSLLGLSLAGPTFFYLITNFGVWLSSSTYAKDVYGLLECYVLALPFYGNSLFSTLLFSLLFLATRNLLLRKNSSQLI